MEKEKEGAEREEDQGGRGVMRKGEMGSRGEKDIK